MTVTNESNNIAYAGNGTTTSFPFPYKAYAESDIKVYSITATAGASLLGTGYTLSYTDITDSCNVNFTTAPASGTTVYIERELDIEQTTDLPTGGAFLETVIEKAFDYITMVCQQLSGKVNRSVLLPVSSGADGELPYPSASRYLRWNSTGTALENATVQTATGSTNIEYLSNYSSLEAAVSSIGSTAASLFLDTSSTLTAGVTVPTNIEIIGTKNGLITIPAGATLEIDGPFWAGLYQIFDSYGGVVFENGTVPNIRPEWFGAKVDDDTAGTSTYCGIMQAIASTSGMGVVQFADGIYYTSDPIIITDEQNTQKNIVLRGNGMVNSFIYHIGAGASGCIGIYADATFATTYYASSGHGLSHLEHIAIGSTSGPALHRRFTGNHVDRYVNLISAGTSNAYVFFEGCIEFYIDHFWTRRWHADWISRVYAGSYAVTSPRYTYHMSDGLYNDGTNGLAPGQIHEGRWFGCRDNGSGHTRECLYACSDTTSSLGSGGNFVFNDCKLSGPTGITNYGTIRIDGMSRGVKFTGGTYIEAQATIGSTSGNITIHNTYGKSRVMFDSNSEWTGYLDCGEYGGTPGAYDMALIVEGCRGQKFRLNDSANTKYIRFINNRLVYYPTTLDTTLGNVSAQIVHDNYYETGGTSYYPITSEAMSIGGRYIRAVNAAENLAGAGTVITLNIPPGSRLLGAQFRVDTAITAVTGTSWYATWYGGSTSGLVSGILFAKNTKAKSMVLDQIASTTTQIAAYPNAGTFSGGRLRCVAYYENINLMYNAP